MKVLLLATTSFPFGHSEPLLFDKIEFLQDFDKVYILQPQPVETTLLYELPKNTVVIQLPTHLSTLEKMMGLFHFFARPVREDKTYTEQRTMRWSISHWKVLLNAFSVVRKNKQILQNIITAHAPEFTKFYFYSYWCTEATIAASLLKSNYTNLYVYSRMHAYDLYEERHSPAYLPFRKLLIEKLDKTLFISEQGKHYFLEKHKALLSQPNDTFIVSRLGVKKNNAHVISKSDFHTSEYLIVSCSSLIPLKRIHLLIEALSYIQNHTITWVHFGDGKLTEELKVLAKQTLQHSNISFDFKGFVLNSEIKTFYENHPVDLFVNTSQYEGLPISMMEAMSYGIPCIGTNVGGVSEIINAHNGYLLEVDFQPIELSNTIQAFLNLPEESRKQKAASALHTWEEKFNGEKNLNELRDQISKPNQECTLCLFSTSMYTNITFDEQGVCNVCHANAQLQKNTLFAIHEKQEKLTSLLDEIKKQKNVRYDCLVGLSGGVDSSYVALKAKEWGLNPLILHIDNGWNSELASMNIENMVKKLGFDLYTYVIHWKEMCDVQLAFLKSSVVDIDLPMDNAIGAIQFKIANKFGIKYILSGINTATEGWMPTDFSHYKLDALNIRSIHRKYGKHALRTFPTVNPFSFYWNIHVKRIKFCAPLDYLDYNKKEAKEVLRKEFAWRDYGGKHYENIFTKFYQGVILPEKFHFDKRISHLSVLISSKQITKAEAAIEIQTPPYPPDHYRFDKEFFIKKLGITTDEYEQIMFRNPVSHLQFTSYVNIINRLIRIKRLIFPRK